MSIQNTTIDKTDRDELVDLSIRFGQGCWGVYCRSKVGFVRVFMLPNAEVRRRANELFQLGFSARMIMCPPIGIRALDAITEKPLVERAWESYLDSMNGQTVLDGPAYPDTPQVVLRYAKEFFLEGFRTGTIAVYEILNS
ncbi:MAG TPA: hypothetical protein DEB39_10325 [Planctomycetaceae bacterium]|nr:hypothetical protein [Planctomycetaceae bacterium]